ncbi:MAG: SDR family NAD(P)-dependent oxidoreductase [Crocinitomicaceae bacterium]
MANIIIIGASRGIGFQLIQLLSAKHQVLALSRHTEPLHKLNIKNLRVEQFDLTDKSSKSNLENIIRKHFQKIDILINNAGYLINAPVLDLTEDDIDNMFATNVTGVIKACQVVIPFMPKGAHIVNIGSMGGFQGSSKFVGLSAYSSSKAAIASFTECLAEELKDKEISANCLALGAVQTEMLEAAFPDYQAPVSAKNMAEYISQFSLTGQNWFNGKVLPVSLSTP